MEGGTPVQPAFPDPTAAPRTDFEEEMARRSSVGDTGWFNEQVRYQYHRLFLDQAVYQSRLQILILEFCSSFVALLRFILRSFFAWLRTLVFSPLTLFADPVNTFSLVVIAPVVVSVLVGALFVQYVISAARAHPHWRHRSTLSLINRANPSLFFSKETTRAVKSARATLSGLSTTFSDAPTPSEADSSDRNAQGEDTDLKTTRIFDLDVAKVLLVLSALVYEVSHQVQVSAPRPTEDAHAPSPDSASFVGRQAEQWGLRYLDVFGASATSDRGTRNGPNASIFYSPPTTEKPFMILCFKGTTPTNFAEFLVDSTISRVSSAAFFGNGTAHEGFLRELFAFGAGSSDNYGQITRSLRRLANDLSSFSADACNPVPLWITGHSLGAALAGLIYARYLQAPADLGSGVVLRDGYTFGAPRLGDGAFVSSFEKSASNPIERPNILWRVCNGLDLVTHLPPGFADDEVDRASLSALSVLNYGHIGVPFSLHPFRPPYYAATTSSLHSATRVVIVKDGKQGAPSGLWLPSWVPRPRKLHGSEPVGLSVMLFILVFEYILLRVTLPFLAPFYRLYPKLLRLSLSPYVYLFRSAVSKIKVQLYARGAHEWWWWKLAVNVWRGWSLPSWVLPFTWWCIRTSIFWGPPVFVLLVVSVWNHFPGSYYENLSQIKVDGQGGRRRSTATTTGAHKKVRRTSRRSSTESPQPV